MAGTQLTPFHRTLSPSGQSTGTWTRVGNTGNPYWSKSAAANASKNLYTIGVEWREDDRYGVNLTGINIPVRVATANLVSLMTLTVYKRKTSLAVAAAGVNMTVSTVAGSATGNNLTAATTDRMFSWTPTATLGPDYSYDPQIQYFAEFYINAATTSAVRVYDGLVFYQVPL